MPWAKLDDSFYDHEKPLAIGNDALAVWTCALSFSSRKRTEGCLTAVQVAYLLRLRRAPPGCVEELVVAGLWERDGDDYQIHDFLDWNLSNDELAQLRAK